MLYYNLVVTSCIIYSFVLFCFVLFSILVDVNDVSRGYLKFVIIM